MPQPKLTIKEIRRHPAVITNSADFQPGLEIGVCFLISPIDRRTRCGQGLMGVVFKSEHVKTRIAGFQEGYSHTPTWGIVVKEVATINWVNEDNAMHEHPYASLLVTRSNRDQSPAEQFSNPAHSVSEIRALADALPQVSYFNYLDEHVSYYDRRTGFENLGLAPNPDGFDDFVVDLSKLA